MGVFFRSLAQLRMAILDEALELDPEDPIRVALEPLQSQRHYLAHTPAQPDASCTECKERFMP